MLQLPIGSVLHSSQSLAAFAQVIRSSWARKERASFDRKTFEQQIESAREFSEGCKVLGLDVSAQLASDLVALYGRTPSGEDGDPLIERDHMMAVHEMHSAIQYCFRRESASRVALVLTPANFEMFENGSLSFGADVASKFSSVTYEIEEGFRCLALARSTAAAFHFIRSLEAALTALSRCLAIPDPVKAAQRNWGNMLREIEKEIAARWPASTGRQSGDGQFFDEAFGALSGMKNPYRNSTMHLDQKYTTEEATSVMELVKNFMKKIAARMDESGLPLA